MLEYWKNAFLKNYANFDGRARRSEYWYYTLMNFIIIISFYVLIIIGMIMSEIIGMVFSGLYVLFLLASFIPSLAVAVRRLHDTGKSGWMLLIGLIPLIGAIWLFVLMVTDSQEGNNDYGPNPKTNTEELINSIN